MARTETAPVETAPVNPMEVMVEVFIDRVAGEDPNAYVGLNGKRYLIPKGKYVKIPKPVANILRASQEARMKRDAYIEGEQEKGKEPMGFM